MSLGFIGLYVLLVGLASFAEKPISGRLDAYELTVALKIGTVGAAVPALLLFGTWGSSSILGVAAGVGIGLIAGVGAAFYCFAVERLPLWFAASFSNAYVIVTATLGILVLGEPLTILKAGGLVLTISGVILLSIRGTKTGRGGRNVLHISLSVLLLFGYVGVVGLSTFLEKPALHALAPLQLNALVAVGMVIVALVAVLVFDRSLPSSPSALGGLGVGALIGLGGVFYYLGLNHLAVSVAATLSDSYVLVPVVLGITFLGESLNWLRAAGIAATLVGVVLISVRA